MKRGSAVPLAVIGCATLNGCAQRGYFQTHTVAPATSAVVFAAAPESPPRQLPMFVGSSGVPLDWPGLMNAVAWADVIIVGEQHDDAKGHAVEEAIVRDALMRWPRSALSMEMLERDDQNLVEDYLGGIINASDFAKLTFSESWAGSGSWKDWYQPIVDAAKDSGSNVVAANAPRRYVRLARIDGYARLQSIPQPRRALFDLPRPLQDDGYRKRFFELMSESEQSPATQPATAPATQPGVKPGEKPAAKPQSPHGGAGGPANPEAAFRSQLVWDATMAGSIADARKSGARKVVHIVGQFHCDFNGGTVQQLRARAPDARILVISMQPEDGARLRADDRNRADVVIYTGRHPQKKEESPQTQPHAAPDKPAASQPASPAESEPPV